MVAQYIRKRIPVSKEFFEEILGLNMMCGELGLMLKRLWFWPLPPIRSKPGTTTLLASVVLNIVVKTRVKPVFSSTTTIITSGVVPSTHCVLTAGKIVLPPATRVWQNPVGFRYLFEFSLCLFLTLWVLVGVPFACKNFIGLKWKTVNYFQNQINFNLLNILAFGKHTLMQLRL